jgi:hypothetical protein
MDRLTCCSTRTKGTTPKAILGKIPEISPDSLWDRHG